MKAVIFGIGRMGKAIAFAMHKQGFEVVGVDSQPETHESLNEIIPEGDFIFYHTENLSGDLDGILSFENPDVVISSLPYHQTLFLAKYCVVNKIRYCDLGGSVPVSKEINEYAKAKAEKPVMTDLGLAPGWVNIVAEWGYSEMHGVPEKISMMVGGLPVSQENPPLDYVVTWSIDGLINEYRDDCEILKDGKILKVKGMDGYEKVFIDWIGKKMEAFYTSGGASHTIKDMKGRGVKECTYKTLRYIGHRNAVRFLIRDCELPDECLIQIFEKGCADTRGFGDMVLIKAKVEKEDLVWHKEICVPHDEQFSAMQRATAFPISVIAGLMGEGAFDERFIERRGYKDKLPVTLSYKDVPFKEFDSRLKKLGIG